MGLRKFIGRLNLKTKLISIYLLTIIIPLIIVGQVILTISGNQIIHQATDSAKESAKQINRNLMELLVQCVDISNRYCFDDNLKNYLSIEKKYKNILESINAYNEYLKPITFFYDTHFSYENLSLKIYYLNKTLIQDWNVFIFADQKIRDTIIYQKAIAANGLMVWSQEKNKILMARVMKDIDDKIAAVVVLEIPENKIFSLIQEIRSEEKSVIIADEDGIVLSSNDRKLIGTSIKYKKYIKIIKDIDTGSLDYREDNNYKLIFETLNGGINIPNWKVITLVPLDALLKDEKRVKNISLVICLACLIVSSIVFVFFLNHIVHRLKILVGKMQAVKEGVLTTVDDDGPNDEIGKMTQSFNVMIDSLKSLIYENYEVKLQVKDSTIRKREAELYALQRQINPHFLFNTLESIRMGVHNKGDRETSEVILHLSKLLRKNIYWQGEVITLAEEIELVKNYLEIQKYRFKNKINYQVDISEDLLNCKILRLIIQPIVENSVRHGIENKWKNGMIAISAGVEAGRLIIRVRDDGVGMAPGILEKVRQKLNGLEELKKSGSIGLKNVQDRIKIHYGAEYGLRIDSIENEGVLVTIELPVVA